MRRLWLVIVLACVFTGIAGAQTSTLPCSANCSLARNQPFSIVYDWAPTTLNPDLADGFTLYQNGAAVSQFLISQMVNGTISFKFASGLSLAGTYTFVVSAYNSGGETPSDSITVTIVKGKPAKPTSGRIQ